MNSEGNWEWKVQKKQSFALCLEQKLLEASLKQIALGKNKTGLFSLPQRFHRVSMCVTCVICICVYLLEEQRPKKPYHEFIYNSSCTCEYALFPTIRGDI